MKSEKKKILSGKECEVMNYLPYFKEPPIDVICGTGFQAFSCLILSAGLAACGRLVFVKIFCSKA